jgi:hypothetical protein
MKPNDKGSNSSEFYSMMRLDNMPMFIVLNVIEEKTMKLKLLFIVMDLLTLLAYPFVFAHGKLCQFSTAKVSVR